MQAFADQFRVYESCHRHPVNRGLHFVGVPLISFGLFLALSALQWTLGEWRISAGMLFLVAVTAYYFYLSSVRLALGVGLIALALCYAADRFVQSGQSNLWLWFALTFVGGWTLLLIGHAVEGRKPALFAGLHQTLISPLFLYDEFLQALGLSGGRRHEDS